MIHLVTLNPALDFHFQLEEPVHGKIGKVVQADVSAGGKALNVSRFLTRLGVRSTTWLGTGGGEHPTHVLYRALLKSENLKVRFLGRNTPIRFNLVTETGENSWKYNHPGFSTQLSLFSRLQKAVKKDDFLVLTGRLPGEMNPTLYRNWLEVFKRNGAHTVLDASGSALRMALKVNPWFFKVNLYELSEGLNRRISNLKDVLRLIKTRLRSLGLIHGAITDGSKGAVLWENDNACWVRPSHVKPRALVVGSGDAFLAGYLAAFVGRKNLVDRARLACAAGAVVAQKGIQGFDPKLTKGMTRSVKVERC